MQLLRKLKKILYMAFRAKKMCGTWREGSAMLDSFVKRWPKGVASRRKLKTWVYSRLRFARLCAHVRWLAMVCAHFGRDQICTQVKASFSPFGHPA